MIVFIHMGCDFLSIEIVFITLSAYFNLGSWVAGDAIDTN